MLMARDPMDYERQKEAQAAERKEKAFAGAEPEMNRKEEAAKAKSEESKTRTTFQKVKERLSKTGIAKHYSEKSKLQSKASDKIRKKYPYDSYTKIKKLQALEHPDIKRYGKAAQRMTSRFSSSLQSQARASDIVEARNARLANLRAIQQRKAMLAPGANKFSDYVRRHADNYNQINQIREYGAPRVNVARELLKLKRAELEKQHKYGREFSILKSHNQLLTPQENNVFSSANEAANNLFSEQKSAENNIFSLEKSKKNRLNLWSS
jgi:hypothetical protein